MQPTSPSDARPPERSHQPPSVGRAVHYYPDESDLILWALEPRDCPGPMAATVASVAAESPEDRVSLGVLLPTGHNRSVGSAAYSSTPRPGCWTWMPHVPPRK